MKKVESVSWVRMVLAFAAVLVVGGSGLSLAVGPDTRYNPVSSVILGPGVVAPNSVMRYFFDVTFTNGATAEFPPTMGATFSVLPATGSTVGSFVVTAPPVGPRMKLTASYTQNGVATTATCFIAVQ